MQTVCPSQVQVSNRYAHLIRFSRRSIIESTFVSMHALKRSAARSKRAARSTLSSSDPVRGCFGDLPATAILPAAAMRSSLKSFIGSMGSAKSLSCSSVSPVRRQADVFSKVLSNSWSTRIQRLGVCPAVTAERQQFVLHLCRALYHRRTRRKRNWRRDQSPDHSHKLRPFTTQQTTINSITVQRQSSVGFLGQKRLDGEYVKLKLRDL